MTWPRVMALRVREMFAKRRLDAELDEELQLHIEMLAEENMQRGMPAEEARRAARIAFGGVEQIKEAVRDERGMPFLESLVADVRFALRMLRKNPGFTAIVVLTLALGIGANTAVFSVVNATLLRPLPYEDPSKLVWLTELWPRMNNQTIVPDPEYTNWSIRNLTFESIAAYYGNEFNLSGPDGPERVPGARVTASFFDLLRIQPFLGRAFLPPEDQPGGPHVVVLSYSLWRGKFSQDPGILGKAITLDGQSYVVVGIMPENFRFPDKRMKVELLIPLGLPPKVDWSAQRLTLVRVIGRLKPGVTLEQAETEISALSLQANSQVSPPFLRMRAGMRVMATTLREKLVGDVRPFLFILLGAVGCVLLIACANVANLQLIRAAARQKELAVRAAIGATRPRLVRQLLTESVLLAVLGGLAGLGVAVGGTRMLRIYLPDAISQVGDVLIDRWVLGFALVLTCFTGIFFGVAPALSASKPDINSTLKEGGSRSDVGHARVGLRSLLAVSELALALMVLIGSGLLIRTFVQLKL